MTVIKDLLLKAFDSTELSPEEESIIAAYEYQCVMLDHAENLEDFDHWTIRTEVGEVRAR
jgi:hypothetical protein